MRFRSSITVLVMLSFSFIAALSADLAMNIGQSNALNIVHFDFFTCHAREGLLECLSGHWRREATVLEESIDAIEVTLQKSKKSCTAWV